MQKTILVILRALFSGIQTIASGKPRISAFSWPSRRILVAAGLLLLVLALIAPAIPAKAYYRLPSDGGVFEPPVDVDWVERHECIVHMVNQTIRGDYYLECPYTNHRLLLWSPIIALSGVVLVSVGIRTTRGKPLVPMPKFAAAIEVLTGAEGMTVAFFSLFMRHEFETYVGLLGYPIGFLLVLDGLRRSKVSLGGIVSAAVMILLISGVFFFFALIGAMAMSEY